MGSSSCKDATVSYFPGHYETGARSVSSGFTDLIFLPAGLRQQSLESNPLPASTGVQLGKRYASRPLDLSVPLLLSANGVRSRNLSLVLARAATLLNTAFSTGDAGLMPVRVAELCPKIILHIGPSRLGISPQDLRRLAAIELVLNTANHGFCLFQPSTLFEDQADAAENFQKLDIAVPTPVIDFHNANTLRYKVMELREATDFEIPICFRAGGDMSEVIRLAAACEVDVVIIDTLETHWPVGPKVLRQHLGLPTLAALAQAVRTCKELNLEDDMDLIMSGAIRQGAAAAICLALGARAVVLESECFSGLGCQSDDGQDGNAPLFWEEAAQDIADYCIRLTRDIQIIAQVCGKNGVHQLNPGDLRALSLQTAALTGVALAGSDRRY